MHKGAKALFWGPPPFPNELDMKRMKDYDPYYTEKQFEVLLPPCVLVKSGASKKKNIPNTKSFIPEYFAQIPETPKKTKTPKKQDQNDLEFIEVADYDIVPITISILISKNNAIYLYANDYVNRSFTELKKHAIYDSIIYDARVFNTSSASRTGLSG